jgi:hypothetical protein
LLEQFKQTGKHVAPRDEFGGIVRPSPSRHHGGHHWQLPGDERLKPTAKRRDDGSWLVDGMLDTDEFERLIPAFKLHPKPQRDYQTFGGFIMKHLGHVPHEGESFRLHGYLVEVIDMDGHRVDKVLLMPSSQPGSKNHLPAHRRAPAPDGSPNGDWRMVAARRRPAPFSAEQQRAAAPVTTRLRWCRSGHMSNSPAAAPGNFPGDKQKPVQKLSQFTRLLRGWPHTGDGSQRQVDEAFGNTSRSFSQRG